MFELWIWRTLDDSAIVTKERSSYPSPHLYVEGEEDVVHFVFFRQSVESVDSFFTLLAKYHAREVRMA